MADCASLPSCVHLKLRQIQPRKISLNSRHAFARVLKREWFPLRSSLLIQCPLPQDHDCVTPILSCAEETLYLKRSTSRCYCFGSLSNPESLWSLNWVPLADQVLLITSIIFAHMAGVVPQERNFGGYKDDSRNQEPTPTSSTSYGRSVESGSTTNSRDSWDEVKMKLIGALNAIQNNVVDKGLNDQAISYKTDRKNHPLSLHAIAEGPRLRLFLDTLQHLQKELDDISGIHEADIQEVWLETASELIKESVQPVFINWLKEEFTLENEEPDVNLLKRVSLRLKEGDRVLQDVLRCGKADLYADLLFFLKFGSLRSGCHDDKKFLNQFTVDILEDLVIMLADVIANIYLELISVDSSISSEMNGFGSNLCSLSTRALQRLRNEVTLNQWIQQNFESVISMYEDRFDLFVFSKKEIEDPVVSQDEKHFWWKKLSFKKSTTASQLHHVYMSSFPLPVKRTKELRALVGWRYYFSLILEFSDITMPFVRAVFVKISDAVSFFLVCLIGRSLGLIYTGIRQALGLR
ncbi:hypothetical protein IHE45_01G008500 [Dioscorea alata]|uniref:Uncharacterized protein n=1 Tax=Dioscorea alata TaxID=55571 RepID=A0ACB7WT73_DIOAL|nr:hypothetical protein IHE45_01G008500 [Dioscorea alata]